MDNASPENAALQQSLASLAKTALEPEQKEAGPGDVGPTDTTVKSPLVTLPQLSKEEVDTWWKRVKMSDERVDSYSKEWDILLKEYLPIVKASGEPETVKVPKHFRNIHSKIGNLWYRTPELSLEPRTPSPADDVKPNPMMLVDPMAPPLTREDIIAVKQSVLEFKLGRDGINYNRLMDELLFDVLAWAGIGCSKIGYTCVTQPIQQPVMVPAQVPPPAPPMPGSVLGLGAPAPVGPPPMVPLMGNPDPITGEQKPVTRTVQVPVFEDYYERRFSPKKLITNADLYSSRIDQDATMMGFHFYLSPKRAMKMFGLTQDEVAKGTSDDKRFKHEKDASVTGQNDLVHGVELWIRASYYVDGVVHPQVLYQLVLIEGVERACVWRPSPDQTIGEDGKLTEDSLIGFPIKVMTIRDLADSLFTPSDSAFTNSTIKQLSTWRRQAVELRDAAIGHYLYDSGAFDGDTLKLIQEGKVGRHIPVESGRMKDGTDKIWGTTAQVRQTPDDARNEELFNRDNDETLGIGSTQAGSTEDTVRSATEIATVQSAVAGRNDKELERVTDFFLDSTTKLDQLLMRYATETDYVMIAGEDGSKRMMAWNAQAISGKYLYKIAPDSQKRIDTAAFRRELLNYYQLAGLDPMTNRPYILRRLARAYGLDPMKAVLNMPPMMPGLVPGAPGVGGQPGGAGGGAPMPPPHGGAVPPASPLNKHQMEQNGGTQNAPGSIDHQAAQPSAH